MINKSKNDVSLSSIWALVVVKESQRQLLNTFRSGILEEPNYASDRWIVIFLLLAHVHPVFPVEVEPPTPTFEIPGDEINYDRVRSLSLFFSQIYQIRDYFVSFIFKKTEKVLNLIGFF